MEDLAFALTEKPEFEYFLGSFVFQSKIASNNPEQIFDENDLLDGQQRMTTLMLLFAVIRDISKDAMAKNDCQECIFQEASEYRKIPERIRLSFAIRDKVQAFIDKFIKQENGTLKIEELNEYAEKSDDLSIQNMAKAILNIPKFFKESECLKPEKLLGFFLNNVWMIFVSAVDLEDAFRLFTILNDRGIPLRNSDILKSMNLGALADQNEKLEYAKMWEDAEAELGDQFDRFLNYVRAILVKEKARLNLLQEYEDNIYSPKERNKATGKPKPILLNKGHDAFAFIERYLNHYRVIFSERDNNDMGDYEFDNIYKLMTVGFPSTDWVSSLLRYFDKYKAEKLLPFLKALDVKFSANWIGQYTPTERIDAMNAVIKAIDDSKSPDDIVSSKCFGFDIDSLLRVLEGNIYEKKFTKYVLLKLDFIFHNHDHRMNFETLSIEHILPKNPHDSSKWVRDFSLNQRQDYTDKLGNLVLITRRKNSSQGRLDYSEKKQKYFLKSIDTCPNSLRVLNRYAEWTSKEFIEN